MAYKQLKLWFDKELARLLSDKIVNCGVQFNSDQFIKSVDQGVTDLELKDRVEFMADQLFDQFNGQYRHGLKTLLQILGPENMNETGMFANYYWILPIAKYVEKYGLDNFEISIKAIEKITKRSTGEYAIRPFIERYPQRTIEEMFKWSKNDNFHLRRLASEGGRPRLPWATKLQIFIDDPLPLLPILDQLKDDKIRYVQKSVANCVNDILKDNIDIGKDLINKWSINPTRERIWIISHGMRNLLKEENAWAVKVKSQLC